MKKFIFSILPVFMIFLPLQAQIIKPYSLQTKVEKTGENTYNLIITGTLEPDWHFYTLTSDPGGSNPLRIEWEGEGKDYVLVGKPVETGTHKAFNEIFGVTETFWSDKILLTQQIKLKNPEVKQIRARLDGQVCKEACLLVKDRLTFDLTKAKQGKVEGNSTSKKGTTPSPGKNASSAGKKNDAREVKTPSANGKSKDSAQDITPTKAKVSPDTPDDNSSGSGQSTVAPQDKKETVQEDIQIETANKKGLLWIFLMSLLGGLIALLTPCIYPMIPLTISFFTKQENQLFTPSGEKKKSGKSDALLYGFFIVLIYVSLSIPFYLIEGVSPNIFNKIATNPWLNLFFFIIFLLFALSFLGVSALDPQRLIPSKWVSKSDEYSQKSSGWIAIFFMAVTLVLVSFSCTGPILGALLGSVISAAGGAVALTVGLLGFGIGLALPFTVFALFPSMLKSLPGSGGWLNTVKVTLGFIELALALKFLSNADLVLQLHLLEREVFLAFWIAIFFGLSLYLFGLIKLPYDDESPRIGVGRLITGLISLAFTFYMLPGLWGAPLKWISAFPPYLEYSESPHGVGYMKKVQASVEGPSVPNGAKILHDGLIVFNDLDKALAYAEEVGKPLMLDFTGFACVNCRKVENNIWPDKKVHRLLKDKYIIASLYVDDKRELPEDQKYVSKYSGDKIETIGDKWAELQIYEYKSNSQPYYVLITPDKKLLAQPMGFIDDPQVYAQWLAEGLKEFEKRYNK